VIATAFLSEPPRDDSFAAEAIRGDSLAVGPIRDDLENVIARSAATKQSRSVRSRFAPNGYRAGITGSRT
jgi:hypothetical protein